MCDPSFQWDFQPWHAETYMWGKRVELEQSEKGECVCWLFHSPRELDSGAVGLNSGRIQRCCIVSCSTPMSVRVLLSALARLIFPDGKVVGCLGTLGPLVDCVDIWIRVRQLPAVGAPFRCRTATWLILPVVICLSQRLSHACLSTSLTKVKPRMAH